MDTNNNQDNIPNEMPHNFYAERCVLGAMISDSDIIFDVIDKVSADDFYALKNSIIFETIENLYSHGDPIDLVAVIDRLDTNGQLESIGGSTYVYDLVESLPAITNAPYYANIVKNNSKLRSLIHSGNAILKLAGESYDRSPDVLIDEAQTIIYRLIDKDMRQDYEQISDVLVDTLEEINRNDRNPESRGILTGFKDIDDITDGFKPGQMIVVAARPGIGKSTLALDFARYASVRQKKSVALFSLEMTRTEIAARFMAAQTGQKLRMFRTVNGMGPEAKQGFAGIIEELRDIRLFIDDSPNMTMSEIRSKAHRIKQKHGLDMLIVDYLQLMSSGKKTESRQQEVSDFSRSLKLLAKELNIPVIAVAALNRGAGQMSDASKMPTLINLRESGSIEQDADIVLLIHRDPNEQDPAKMGDAKLIVAKNRNGQTPIIDILFQGAFARFMPLYKDYTHPVRQEPGSDFGEDAPESDFDEDAPGSDFGEDAPEDDEDF